MHIYYVRYARQDEPIAVVSIVSKPHRGAAAAILRSIVSAVAADFLPLPTTTANRVATMAGGSLTVQEFVLSAESGHIMAILSGVSPTSNC